MADAHDAAIAEAARRIDVARVELEVAAAILRGPAVPASKETMRAEQQLTNAISSLRGIVL